jgi:radical SAM superfamily enzyme YgiQ (UPF0313 family)
LFHVDLIIPKWPPGSLWSKVVFRFPYLSLTTLAAHSPSDVQVRIVDENVERVDLEASPDLVGISLMTPLAPRGYEIADGYRRRGIPVVLGGIHATMMPDEAAQHAHAVMVGEAETQWAQILRDVRAGELRPMYRAMDSVPLHALPLPRRELLNRKAYFFINTLQTTRGCPFDCDFCSVTQFFGNTYRIRPVEEVEREIQSLEGRFVFFVDDNIVGNREYAAELFRRLIPYRLKWVSQSAITLAKDTALLELARQSGCLGLFIGFESLSQEALKSMGKNFNVVRSYRERIRRIHDHGIGIQGSFIFGNDDDTPDIFDDVVRFTEETRLDAALFSILTPFPGTRLYERMSAQGRILSHDWSRYDMNHVVFQPQRMTPEQLQEGFNRAYERLYSWASIGRRLMGLRRNLQLFLPMNIGFRRAWNEVLADQGKGGE